VGKTGAKKPVEKPENGIRRILSAQQIDLFGTAGISGLGDELSRYGGPVVAGYASAISIGIALNPAIVDGLADRMNPNNASLYHSHAYTIVNARLDAATSLIASWLVRRGFRALPVPAAERTDPDNAAPTVSHKTIARLSGLGWIGKSCLLVAPGYGPRVRFASILTDAEFGRAVKPAEERCGSCTECVKACPAQAIRGRNFRDGEDRSARFDFAACQDYFDRMKRDDRRKPVCGMCLYVCPHGRGR
jgi:epoxyqueuosine reductase